MRKIYKFRAKVDGIPFQIKGHITRLLDVQYQEGIGVVLWAEVNDDAKEIEITVVPVGTGWPIPEQMALWDYIGTAQENGYVWHYYVEPFHNPDRKEIHALANSFFGGLSGMEGHQTVISNDEINRIVDAWNAIPN